MALKEKDINRNFGRLVIYQGRRETLIGKINSKVHSETKVVGLDLMDGCPVNLLAHISEIKYKYIPKNIKP